MLVASTVAAVLLVLVIVDWSDPCRGQITDLLGCATQLAEEEPASADPGAGLPPIDDREALRRSISDLADYLDLQTDAEYCADFPEDAACNGTDP